MSDNREMIVLNGELIDELVRCKDCKYCLIHDKILFCGYMGSIGEWRYRTETDYCSRGEVEE